MTQYEQENDLGAAGGEVDDERRSRPGADADERRGGTDPADEPADAEPWAKTSSGDADEA